MALHALIACGLLLAIARLGFAQEVPPGPGTALLGLVLAGHVLAGCVLFRPGAGAGWRWLGALGGTLLAAGAAAALFSRLGFSRPLLEIFFSADLLVFGLVRGLQPGLNRRQDLARWTLAGICLFHLFDLFLRRGSEGSGDGYWYSMMVRDFVEQWRAGIFPALVGATEYAFNGALFPHRLAPLILHEAGLLDLLTWHQLSALALLNSVLLLSAVGGFLSAYACVRRILPAAPWTATGLALLYIASPAALGLFYTGALFMSVTTLPFVPLVWFGVWRAADLERPLPVAAGVLPLAAAWLGHPPIALWLHVMLAGALAFRWARLWRAPRRVGREVAGVGLLFVALAGFIFVSALGLGPGDAAGLREVSLANVVNSFPAVLKPVSPAASAISDYQPGLGLWVLLAAALLFWLIRARERRAGWMVAGTGAMMVLLLPVPYLTAAVWRHLPQLVIDATYHWPTQRLAVIFAGSAVLTVAATWRLAPRRAALAGSILLWLGVAWTQVDAAHFLSRGLSMLTIAATARKDMALNNAMLTRYAFLRFPAAPAYFSHGYVDPTLEHRLLSSDGRRTLLTNREAVLHGTPAVSTLQADFDGVQIVVLPLKSPLLPGARHYYRLEWLCPPPVAGSLLVINPAITRIYNLPDSGLGMTYQTQSRAFGLLPGNTDGFSLWLLPGSAPQKIELQHALPQRPLVPPSGDYARLSDYSYRPEDLPIEVHSFAPYRLTVRSPESGLLETPRMFLDGYRATVDGKSVAVQRSADGLVTIPVPAGASEVTLAFLGRPLLRFSYWLAFLTWTAAGAWALVAWLRRLFAAAG